MLFEALYMPM